MKNARVISLFIITGLLGLCTVISVSYAYYTVVPANSTNVTTNVTLPSCIAIALSGTSTISLSGDTAAPVQDYKVLDNDDSYAKKYEYTFTVKNACTSQTSLVVAMVPTSSSTLAANYIKYALTSGTFSSTTGTFLDANGTVSLSAASKSDLKLQTGKEYTSGYKILTTTLPASTSRTYKLRVWIDYDEDGQADNITNDKVFSSYVVVSSEL